MGKQFKGGVTPPPPKTLPTPPATVDGHDAPRADTNTPKSPKSAKRRTGKNANKHNPNRPKTGKTGRPKYVPSDHDKEQVRALAGYGLTAEQIADVLGISIDTFNVNAEIFSPIVKQGRAMAAASVSQALFNGACAGDTGKIIWWEKTRAGRTDRVVVETSGLDGAPIETKVEHAGEVTTNVVGRIGVYLPFNHRTEMPSEHHEEQHG